MEGILQLIQSKSMLIPVHMGFLEAGADLALMLPAICHSPLLLLLLCAVRWGKGLDDAKQLQEWILSQVGQLLLTLH